MTSRKKLDKMLLDGARVPQVMVTPVGKSHKVGWEWGFIKKFGCQLDANIIIKFDRNKEKDDKENDKEK